MRVPNIATKKGLKKVFVDTEKEYNVSESMGEAPLKPSLIFSLPLKEYDPDLLILYVHQFLMKASDGMKELDGFSFDIKTPEGLQPKGFESVLNTIPGLMGCCILQQVDLDCYDEGHPQNAPERWRTDEIINFYILLIYIFRCFFLFTLSINQISCHVILFFIHNSKESLCKRLQ